MISLIKKNIHMNRQKGTAVSQLTLDDDFIVPDSMDDVAQVLLDQGELQVESARAQGERMLVKGKLSFSVLYRKAEGGLQAMGGEIPFDEVVNVPGLLERDETQVSWILEDLNASIINSRKLSIKAVVTLEVRAEGLSDAEAAVDLETDGEEAEILKRNLDVAMLAARRRDTYRIKEDIQVSGNKPNIETILWNEMRLKGVSCRPIQGALRLDGELMVFIIYAGEGEHTPVQWMEESIPFSGEIELPEAREELIPAVGVRILHRGIEMKPDYDGEMREFELDAVLELDMKLYQEENVELLSDLYSTREELILDTGEACFERLLARNICKCKVNEQIRLKKPERILQICHSSAVARLDEAEAGPEGLSVDGVLDVSLLYLTDDDAEPVGSAAEVIPFHCLVEAPGMNEESIWQLNLGTEQLTAVMLGGDSVEVKAVISADLLAMQPICETVVTGVRVEPPDLKRLQELPGIVGYVVQPGDTLWKIAKKFHTTVDNVRAVNYLSGEEIKPGEKLVLMKEIR